ncbi:unnamed protein product [Ectocarpus fasciculatus]
MSSQGAKSLCGLPGFVCLQKLYAAINTEGEADNMVFYDSPQPGPYSAPRKSTFRGINGLFFCLVVMRTGMTLVVASMLFGVSPQTGGRAFTTWVKYLRGKLRPWLRLPEVDEVAAKAPANFKRKQMEKVVVVLDATEIETVRVWHTNLAFYLYSTYKHKPTGKVLIGVTPSGVICYISSMYGGRMSDTELVARSGVISELVEKGFGSRTAAENSGGGMGGYMVMADRGFNGIAMQLYEAGLGYVAPPATREHELQFKEVDAEHTRDVANLRIHVERAIGALKQWKMCENKFDSSQMDVMPLVFEVCGALVNMLNEPFVSYE